MRRSLLIAVALAALAALAVPAVASTTVSVPAKFRSVLPKVRSKSGVPIRLPARVRTDSSKVYGAVEGLRSGRYHLSLGLARGCHEATACFLASFFAKRGAAPDPGLRKVSLAHGIVGRYRPISCGASCAAAAVQWRENRVAYEIQYKGSKRQMVALANSAIRRGGN